MIYTEIVTMFLGISLLLYLILCGADFGAGILELLLGDHGVKTVYRAIAPIWEANHMWLIIAVVILFNGFPPAYALVSTVLHIPIMMVLIGIILRGTAFTFRHYDAITDSSQELYSMVFRYSSLFTVFSLGLIIGPLISGTIPVEMSGSFYSYFIAPWLNGFSISVGLFLMTLSAYIAAIYLLGEVRTDTEYASISKAVSRLFFLSMIAGIALFAFSYVEGNSFQEQFLTHPLSIASVVLASLIAPFIFTLIRLKRIWTLRVLVAAQMTLILLGMLFIQFPNLVKFSDGTVLDIYGSTAPESTMIVLFWALAIGLCIILPSLVYLFWIFKSHNDSNSVKSI